MTTMYWTYVVNMLVRKSIKYYTLILFLLTIINNIALGNSFDFDGLYSKVDLSFGASAGLIKGMTYPMTISGTNDVRTASGTTAASVDSTTTPNTIVPGIILEGLNNINESLNMKYKMGYFGSLDFDIGLSRLFSLGAEALLYAQGHAPEEDGKVFSHLEMPGAKYLAVYPDGGDFFGAAVTLNGATTASAIRQATTSILPSGAVPPVGDFDEGEAATPVTPELNKDGITTYAVFANAYWKALDVDRYGIEVNIGGGLGMGWPKILGSRLKKQYMWQGRIDAALPISPDVMLTAGFRYLRAFKSSMTSPTELTFSSDPSIEIKGATTDDKVEITGFTGSVGDYYIFLGNVGMKFFL